jgi:hypothetical protein
VSELAGRESGEQTPPDPRNPLAMRADALEESYEFFLAYAAQGLQNEQHTGSQIRTFLRQFDGALDGLGQFFTEFVGSLGLDVAPYRSFIAVIDRDAGDARAAVQMVLAQPSIHSQMIDNLNANIHIRALLTDLFLIDEILRKSAGN